MILIGSRALVFRAPFLLQRAPKDFDFIGKRDEILSWLSEQEIVPTQDEGNKIIAEGEPPCEFEVVDPNRSNQMLVDLVEGDPQTIKTDFGLVPNIDLLFTLKASHRYLKNSPHFWKTAVDYHRMKKIGCKVRPEYMEFFKLREKETYTYAHPKLNVKKDSFFSGDQVKYVFIHDHIHESVKLLEKPAYLYYLKDNEEVQCDKEKFFSLPNEIRLAGVVEEAAVLAIERALVPYPDKWTSKNAWIFALAKVCSSITSGWFREYAYENIFEVVKLFPEGFWEKFQQDVTAKKVGYV